MKTVKEISVKLGELGVVIDVIAEVNEKEEDQYNQLIFQLYQRTDTALDTKIRIYSCTKQEVLELGNKIKSLAKYFPNEN